MAKCYNCREVIVSTLPVRQMKSRSGRPRASYEEKRNQADFTTLPSVGNSDIDVTASDSPLDQVV